MHCVKHGPNLQSTISLSSEYYALVKASAIGMSVRALLEDWGEKYDLATVIPQQPEEMRGEEDLESYAATPRSN